MTTYAPTATEIHLTAHAQRLGISGIVRAVRTISGVRYALMAQCDASGADILCYLGRNGAEAVLALGAIVEAY